MAAKKPFVLRLNPEMLKELERWAAAEFRSVNGQIEYILFDAIKKYNKNFKLKDENEKEE
ncbi:Arc family DNA-binding protein [Solitalea sp. MAHUQ-68]|uniref:Arc family DNA-binding protein n=1 Tax=Solitalea agri TaxID=2953739 RepID=A0A9X2JE59_9SPHI|nr:Arc family DNA-binding protein [Solitalea agri]MCO4293605.1 Arc family DNA-binding protein [Solitalea agri]